MSDNQFVYIVDDDEAVRRLLTGALKNAGFSPVAFSSAEELLVEGTIDKDQPGCILIDFELPGMDGPTLQDELTKRGIELPVVMISGHADVDTAVQVMRAGAVDVLQKPFAMATLVQRLHETFEKQADRLERRQRSEHVRQQLERLSKREQDVFGEILSGKSNKQIAAALDIGVQTVAKHKARILRKVGVKNDLELLLLVSGERSDPDV